MVRLLYGPKCWWNLLSVLWYSSPGYTSTSKAKPQQISVASCHENIYLMNSSNIDSEKLTLLSLSLLSSPLFLYAVLSLSLMIVTDWLTKLPIGNWQSLRFLRSFRSPHSKWNVTQNGMSLKMECHSKWIVPQNGMSL